MDHQPFKTWIFSTDAIKPEEQQELRAHLQSCVDCQRLSMTMDQIEYTFVDTPAPIPAPGFTKRWQTRLALHRQALQQRQMWMLTLAMFALAFLLSLSILLLEWSPINWFYEISQLIANFSRIAAQANRFWVVFRSINKTLPVFIPIMLVFGVGGISAAIALIVTWLNALVNSIDLLSKEV